MATLSFAQTYAYARQAGFDPATAVTITAIAMGESGLKSDNVGDVALQDATWGPSVGLLQIRTVKSETGRGTDRDITKLSDPLQNLIAAYHISNKGKDFTPWTIYNNQDYKQYLGQAAVAAGGAAGTVTNTGVVVNASLATDLLTGNVDFKGIGLRLLAIAAGGALVIAGLWQATGMTSKVKTLAKVAI